MSIQEFSNNFDTMLNSYANKMPFGEDASKVNLAFDEYEKSVFLTDAQNELVIGLYTGRNLFGNSFETTEEIRRYLANLVCDATLFPVPSQTTHIDRYKENAFFNLPTQPKVWYIIYESVVVDKGEGRCGGEQSLAVTPVRHDEWHRIKKNPFRGINGRKALRLDVGNGQVEIASDYPIVEYYLRYLRGVKPIVLESLTDTELDIEGQKEASEACELPESIHYVLLEMAGEKALRSRGINKETNK